MHMLVPYSYMICRIYAAKGLIPNRKDEKTFVVSLHNFVNKKKSMSRMKKMQGILGKVQQLLVLRKLIPFASV